MLSTSLPECSSRSPRARGCGGTLPGRGGTSLWHPPCPRPEGLVQPVRLDPTGRVRPTRGQARGTALAAASRGWYVPAGRDLDRRRAAHPRAGGPAPAHAALSPRGRPCAGAGPRSSTGWRPVTVAACPFRLSLGGWADLGRIRASSSAANGSGRSEIESVAGVPCAFVERSVFDEMRRVGPATHGRSWSTRHGDRRQADHLDRVRAYVAGCNGVDGRADDPDRAAAGQRGQSFAAGDADAPELGARRRAPDARVQPAGVRPGRQSSGLPDLFDPVAGFVGEYDGADHRAEDRRARDAVREERFRDHGLEYFALVRGDLGRPAHAAHRILAARARAKFLAVGDRRWTLDPPSWWDRVG